MEIGILEFIDQCRGLAKQPLGKHAGEPARHGFAAGFTSCYTVFGLKMIIATAKRRIGWDTWVKSAMLST
jgi:hypothetical protein